MVYEVLARKWRPQFFQDVVGQEHITQTLVNAIKSDRIAHAYLFSGARGVGKTSVARILAKALNCLELEEGNPCGRCTSCLEITRGSSVDVQEIDGASNRGIDEIRELRENIKYMPSASRFRVYIIDEVHMLTLQAFNALLKTLEEPPPHVKFIFATTEPHKVPITILSRCQRFDFKRIAVSLIMKHIEEITEKEGIEISKPGVSIIAREAEGSMRDAESLLDQVISYAGTKVTEKDIIDILGIIDRDLLFDISGAIIDGSAEKCIEIVEKIYSYGYDIKEFYRALMDHFRNMIVCLIASDRNLLDLTGDDLDALKTQATRAGLERLQQSLNILIAREESLRYTSHPRLVLETILVKLCQIGHLLSFDELLGRVESLEKRLTASSLSYERPAVSSVSEPASEWDGYEKDNAGEQEVKSENRVWDKFMDYLATKNRAMANVLREWTLQEMKGNTMKIVRGNSPFSSGYLDDPERFNKLVNYCRVFFKKDMEIDIQGKKPRSNKKKKIDSPSPGLPDAVQEVLQVFGGEVKGEVDVGKGAGTDNMKNPG